MAIEFGSRKETFDNFKVYETMLAARPYPIVGSRAASFAAGLYKICLHPPAVRNATAGNL
jgi:hypothetical protein